MSANTVLSESQLLAWYLSGEKPPVADDISARKHGGNEQSVEANRLNKFRRSESRREVLRIITERPSSMKEVAEQMGVQLNCVSGRASELLKLGLVHRTGEIRDGAAVLESKTCPK